MAPLYATSVSHHLDIPRTILADVKSELFGERIVQTARRAVGAAGPEIAQRSAQSLLLHRSLTVNSTQKVTLGVIAAYTVAIALLWNLPYIRWSLWPFKVSAKHEPYNPLHPPTKSLQQMLVIAFHEFGHAITGCCTGGRVKSIS